MGGRLHRSARPTSGRTWFDSLTIQAMSLQRNRKKSSRDHLCLRTTDMLPDPRNSPVKEIKVFLCLILLFLLWHLACKHPGSLGGWQPGSRKKSHVPTLKSDLHKGLHPLKQYENNKRKPCPLAPLLCPGLPRPRAAGAPPGASSKQNRKRQDIEVTGSCGENVSKDKDLYQKLQTMLQPHCQRLHQQERLPPPPPPQKQERVRAEPAAKPVRKYAMQNSTTTPKKGTT